MNQKRLIWFCAAIGGWIGGYVPLLWGAPYFSFAALICNAVGAMIGIWIGFKLSQ